MIARAVVVRGAMLGALFAAGCAEHTLRSVELRSARRPTLHANQLEIAVASSAPNERGVRYRWFGGAGTVVPAESDSAVTVFTFADGAVRDHVRVEVWRGTTRIARGEADVALAVEPRRRDSVPAAPTTIEITQTPPFEPQGGPDTRADIGGIVRGVIEPGARIVVYARANEWYRQPTEQALHVVRADSTWGTWTHTGSTYAVFLVRRGANLPSRMDRLPGVGGVVLARTIVDGFGR